MPDDPKGTAQVDRSLHGTPSSAERTSLPEARSAAAQAEALLVRRVRLLVLCGAIAFSASTALNVGLEIWTSTAVTSVLSVVMAAMWFGWKPLLRLLSARAVAHATLGACVIAIAVLAIGEGTTRTPNLHFMCLIVVASALLLGVRASRFWTAAAILAAAATYAADVSLRGAPGVVAFNHGLGLIIMLVVLHLLASAAWRTADASMEESEKAAARAREAAIELETANDALSLAMQARSRFLANMSHEIRTPLNAVLGFTDVLLRTSLDSDQRQYTETIRGAGQGLLVIVDDVLDLARIEAGKLTFSREVIDLADTIGSTLDMLGVTAHKKGLELWADIADGAPSHLEADSARIRQVLLNLLGNAVKFTAMGEVVVRLATAADGGARIEVRDTGIGIAESAHGDLFQPFGQADGSTRRRHDGTGLGLVISKKLVEGMGGRIGFTSELGKGSCFWVELPGAKRTSGPTGPIQRLSVALVSGRPVHSDYLAAAIRQRIDGKVIVLPSDVGAAGVKSALAGISKAIVLVDWDPACPAPAELLGELAEARERGVLLLAPLSEKSDELGRRWKSRVAVVHKPLRTGHLVQRMGAFESGDRPSPALPAPATRFQHRVLLVEDNVVNQTVGRLILQSAGCTVRIAADGATAVEAARSDEFDLVLMDLHMPDMDGFDATRAIRADENLERRASVPIVALSASVLPEDQVQCLEVGMNGHLAKPISRKDLEDLLRATPLRK